MQALRGLCHDFRHRLKGFLVDITLYGGPKAVYQVRTSCQKEDIECQLCVERENVWDCWMRADECEKVGYPMRPVVVVFFGILRSRSTGFSRAPVELQVMILVRVGCTKSPLLGCMYLMPTLSLVLRPLGYCIVTRFSLRRACDLSDSTRDEAVSLLWFRPFELHILEIICVCIQLYRRIASATFCTGLRL